MPWLQLRICCEPELATKCESALLGNAALSVTFEDNADQAIFEPELGETPLWNDTRVTGLFAADVNTQDIEARIIKAFSKSRIHTHWHILEDKDWEREWINHYKPIECHDRLWICPSWCEPPKPKAVNLMLDPGLAFGTGTHPTTFMCLQWLAEQNINNHQVIDYGCGSGILGIAALLLGAEQCEGIDIDPQALIATRDNVQRNDLNSNSFPVYLPKDFTGSSANIVLANILAGPLVELAPTLLALLKPQAKLCLSGVLKTQESDIVSAYEKELEITEIRQKEEWICVTGIKR